MAGVLVLAVFMAVLVFRLGDRGDEWERHGWSPYHIDFVTSLDVVDMSLLENSVERDNLVTHVVIHFASDVVVNPDNPFDMEMIHRRFLEYGVSTHYFIDRNGRIYRSVSECRVARHTDRGEIYGSPYLTNRINEYSVGIKLLAIGTKEEMEAYMDGEVWDELDEDYLGVTDKQYEALNRLLDDIFTRHKAVTPSRRYVIGHDEYSSDETSPGSLFDWWRLDFVRNLYG